MYKPIVVEEAQRLKREWLATSAVSNGITTFTLSANVTGGISLTNTHHFWVPFWFYIFASVLIISTLVCLIVIIASCWVSRPAYIADRFWPKRHSRSPQTSTNIPRPAVTWGKEIS